MSLLLDRGSSENTAANRWEQSLVRVAFLPAVITAILSVVAVLTTLLTAGSALTGLFGGIGAVWLAVHQVPVYIGGTDLGALPLLPTLLLFAGVARCSYRFTSPDASPGRQLQIVGAAVGGPLVMTVVALALVADASSALGLSGPGPLASLGGVAAVHGGAALVGVGTRTIWANAARWGVPTWMLTSLRAGVIAALAFFSVGALLVVVGAFIGWTDIAEQIGAEPTVVGQLGLLLLSIMYLPNVMVAGAAVLSGSTAHIGEAGYSLFLIEHGPVPEVPVLGVLPQSAPGSWWPLLLAVCAGIGLWLGWRYRSVGETVMDTIRFYVLAGAVAAMIALVLGFAGSGQLGSFGYLGVDVPIYALYAFGWVTVAGLLVALASMALGRRRGAAVEYEDYAYDEPEDVVAPAPVPAPVVAVEEDAFTEEPQLEPEPESQDDDDLDDWPEDSDAVAKPAPES